MNGNGVLTLGEFKAAFSTIHQQPTDGRHNQL
jgi:hypothetical protein